MNSRVILIGLICIFGLSARFFVFQSQHPDTDELFELRNMQALKPTAMLMRTTFYGDHTSYPGEYLIHYIPMRVLGMFDKPADLSYEDGTIGLNKKQFWILAIPKIIISLGSFYLLWLLCGVFLTTTFGYAIVFIMVMMNTHLTYHAFSLRPYGILPELAIINLYLCTRDTSGLRLSMLHGVVIFLTCIYHAYGPLIAILPVMVMELCSDLVQQKVGFSYQVNSANEKPKRSENVIVFIFVSILVWAYYASHNSFGITPNNHQSIVDSFQFITKENFLNGMLDSLFTGSVLTVACLPFVLSGMRDAEQVDIIFLILMILLPITLIVLVDIQTKYWIHPRQWCWIVPALAMWCGRMAEK